MLGALGSGGGVMNVFAPAFQPFTRTEMQRPLLLVSRLNAEQREVLRHLAERFVLVGMQAAYVGSAFERLPLAQLVALGLVKPDAETPFGFQLTPLGGAVAALCFCF